MRKSMSVIIVLKGRRKKQQISPRGIENGRMDRCMTFKAVNVKASSQT